MGEKTEVPVPDFCDMCGRDLNECMLDYTVVIEVISGDIRKDLGEDMKGDVRSRIEELIREAEKRSEAELMDGVYRKMRFTICPDCQREYIRDPLNISGNNGRKK